MRDIKNSFVTNFYLKISKTNFLAIFSFSPSTCFEGRFVRSAEICVINIHKITCTRKTPAANYATVEN